MKKQKIMKWALPALLMSAVTFELMPGSVKCYAKDLAAVPEYVGYNFFTLESESVAAACLPLAGMVTVVTMILALVCACFKKSSFYKSVSWCSLAASALAAAPYIAASETEFIQPNVIVILILIGCWLVAMSLDKNKDKAEEEYQGRRL